MLSKKDLKKYMWIVSVTKELIDMIPEENKKYIGYNNGKQGLNWKAYEVDLQANIQGKIVMLEGDKNLPKDTRVINDKDTRTIKEMARLNRYNDKQLLKLIREGIIVGTFNY